MEALEQLDEFLNKTLLNLIVERKIHCIETSPGIYKCLVNGKQVVMIYYDGNENSIPVVYIGKHRLEGKKYQYLADAAKAVGVDRTNSEQNAEQAIKDKLKENAKSEEEKIAQYALQALQDLFLKA